MTKDLFLGLDVGTGSVRASLFDQQGKMVAIHVEPITTFTSKEGDLEQSSDEIWSKICECVREVTKSSGSNEVKGIGVCATCSLVALDDNGEPIAVSRAGRNEQNIILWMDHRAEAEAQFINDTKHGLLKYVGGGVSLEMQMPKVLWLKRHLPGTFSKAKYFFDLPDFVTYKLTGSNSRSVCSAVCKWNYDVANSQWSEDFLSQIGLLDAKPKIGSEILSPGTAVPGNLSAQAAQELGLKPGAAVATSMIDAHSGALALLGCGQRNFYSNLAIICGTSSCHMSITREPCFASGIWGPYQNAILNNSFLNEAGQSAAGHLLDFVTETHPFYSTLKNSFSSKAEVIKYLNGKLREQEAREALTRDFHVWPDFIGNRSPLANSSLRGMVSGLNLQADERNLLSLYLATIQAIAYGTKHILSELYKAGRKEFTSVLICGGLSKNELFVQTHADVLGIPIGLPETQEAVLLGGAIMGAAAAKLYSSLEEAAENMSGEAKFLAPKRDTFAFHAKKYKVFLKMVDDQIEYQRIMR